MISWQIETDREVQISGIGVISPGTPVEVSAEELRLFEAVQGVKLQKANFPYYIKVTAVVTPDEDEEVSE